MSNTKGTVCGSGFREAFLPPLPGAKLHIRNYHVPLCTILKVKELESQLSRRIKSPPPPLPIRLSIKKGSGFSMQMPCDKEFVVVVVSSVRSGRRLNKWLALLFKLTFNRSSL